MTKILIEIDQELQRVVPDEPTVKMLCAGRDTPCETTGDDAVDAPEDYRRVYRAMLAAAPQPEPVDVDLRRDAELWRAHQKRKQDLIDRGFLKNCLRSEESAMSQGEQK